MPNITELAAIATQKAQSLGIKKFDIYGSTVDEASVQVDHGDPKQVKASNRASVMVRVWNDDNTMGVTTTTDVEPSGLEAALELAQEASHFGAKENVADFSPAAQDPLPEVTHQKVPQSDIPTLLEHLKGAEKQLLEAHPAINGVPYNGLAQRDTARFYLNSAGAMRQEARSLSSVYLYSKAEQEGKRPRSAGAFRVSADLAELDIQGCLDETVEKTVSHLDYDKIETGKYRVVFSPEAFLSLLGAFSNLYNAQSILDKRSLSTEDSLGTELASPLLSVTDDVLHAGNIGKTAFDDEGTPTRPVTLIENGILKSFLHSAGTAKRMNAQPTGHANIGAKVTVGPHFYHVSPGAPAEQTYSLENAENVVYIDDLQALHAGVKALQGAFSLPFDGWLVNKGKRVSIESATVAGDFRELLKAIIYVEPEAKVMPGGVCPHVWVDGLSITGE
ncbi:Metalloprotease PmbA [Acaryochloris thomasi RCC1774]|uniref:Metalloprotease PmbA n=1 Tax=Acaryochloris thomasi RCC1774 TaxID=1764569 RepID=A0A2W1JSR5_9CYAN|nr:TldD/PmbA family protein [Acaryochloris thomasi]PZD71747.1 Metalloprotease PmbA [Acaryochloris thomasi RCC1774]